MTHMPALHVRSVFIYPLSSARYTETHFTATDTLRDIVIGMSDGLTVPFAIAAGLSGAAFTITEPIVDRQTTRSLGRL